MHEEDPSWLKDTLRSPQLKLRNNMENFSNSGVAPQCISLHLIEEFTNKFSDDRKIGDGTYGDVYKGILHNGEEIAVKMLRFMPEKDDQKQFKNEAENLMRLRHENIVQLIAYSYEVKHKFVEISESAAIDPSKGKSERSTMVLAEEAYRALCFEYLQNGSLQKYLYDESNGLDWPTRYKIIKGTCEALKYLHEGLETPMLHLDLKPDNILLDKNMVPKLADFGLARIFTEEQTRSLQQIAEQKKSQMSGVGTIGYVPPEYIEKNEYSEKFDIFSLGVIIIKIMSGEQGYRECNPMTSRDNDIDRVLGNWRGRLRARAAYTTLEEECHQVKTCIETALDCLQRDPMKRPKIGSIIQRLNETENKIEKLAISLPYNSRNDPGSDANMMPARMALLQVESQELCYRYTNDLNENLASSLQLKNMTDNHVAYMFVVPGWAKLSSSRAKGIITPGSEWEVVLNMKAEHAVFARRRKDKVVLQSTNVSKDLKPDDITLDMFKHTGRIVDEVKLDVVVEERDPSQFRIREDFDKNQEIADDAFKMLDVQPLELRFHFRRNKLVPCSVYLTNTRDESVAFRLTEKNGDQSGCFVQLPLHGILPPGCTHTFIVTTKKLEEPPRHREYDLTLQACVLEHFHSGCPPFEDQYQCEVFFTLVKDRGGLVHEVAMKASQENPFEILSVETTHDIFYCLDTNPIKKWIITGYCSGYVRIGNYETELTLNSFKVSNTTVCAVKFIAHKKYFVAGTFDGFLHVYDYGTKLLNKKQSWKACGGFITSLAIHPTEPYVLSSAYNDPIKLWNWEEGWECKQTFKGHSDLVRQLVFNPTDTNIFASASDDKTIKVWKLDSPFPEYTLDGHSGKVSCLAYFSCGDHQRLISGSDDKTAKIWDLQKNTCEKTLDTFLSPLTCVNAHPNLPVLITGSEDGILRLWSSTNFSLERVLNIASGGDVRGIGCLMGSRRVVICQINALIELSIENMNYHEAHMPCSEQYLSGDEAQEETTPGDTTSEESFVPSGDLLQVHPLQVYFLVSRNKLTPCPVHLTNNTNERVAFMLDRRNYRRMGAFFNNLPLCGIVPPRSTCTLIVIAQKSNESQNMRDIDLILKGSVVTENNIDQILTVYMKILFSGQRQTGDMETLGTHEVTLKAIYAPYEELSSQVAPLSLKVLHTDEEGIKEWFSLDTNEVKQWIVTGAGDGFVHIRNYNTQKPVDSVRVSMEPVSSTKFVSRKQWFLAASFDGFISVYNYETKKLDIRFKASNGKIKSVVVHPTKPYVLSSAKGGPIKLWNWEECRDGCWECTQTFEGHTSGINQITFNPLDTNTFASASKDCTIKVWNLDSRYPEYTLSGHSKEVECVNYFTRGDQLFLISGAHDHTAKIWDLQEKKCVQTLEASLFPVTYVCSHPKLPVLVIGSSGGSVTLWSSTDFRLEKILNVDKYFGGVIAVGFGCSMGSRSILIGQRRGVSVLTMDNMEFEEAASVAFDEPQIRANVSAGATTSGEKKSTSSELLDIEPSELYFPYGLGTITAGSLKLTNKTDQQVAFRLTEKNWSGSPFVNLPLHGVVLPRSTYTLVIATKKLEKAPQELCMNMILQSIALEYQNIYPFIKDLEYSLFFSDVKKAGKEVQEVTIRAVYGDQQGKATSEGTTDGVKILYVEDISLGRLLASVDVHPTDTWIVTGHAYGHVRILSSSDMQGPVASMEGKIEGEGMLSYVLAVACVKFIARKKWIVAGSYYGSISVYSYENNKMQNIERVNAGTGLITSLAVHPTLPLVLSTADGSPIKLWNWEKQWECTKEFDDEHSDRVLQMVFNPVDTNSFASGSRDHTVKVWNLDTQSSVCTLEGQSDQVFCLDYFTCESKMYLITCSKDHTAKIWDLEMKVCVQTLNAFADAVTSVRSHPSLPLLITGSRNGIVQFWNSTTFRLEKVLNFGFSPVVDLGCFKDSRRIVIGQWERLSVIELDEEHIASEDQDKKNKEKKVHFAT